VKQKNYFLKAESLLMGIFSKKICKFIIYNLPKHDMLGACMGTADFVEPPALYVVDRITLLFDI
jgi:hypothetical protein